MAKDALERISEWITEQKAAGRTVSEMDGTVFVFSNEKTGRIIATEDDMFDVEILLAPYTVDFTVPVEKTVTVLQ